jgi:hypothetical protein
METDVDIVVARFRNSSSRIFQFLYEDFKRNIRKLDRQGDENVFQKLQSRYLSELQKQLTIEAEKMIGQYNGIRDINLLRRELASQISYNISEFLVKIRSM